MRFLLTSAVAGACAATVALSSGAQAQDTKSAPVTITGCVYQEKDVPGRAPNIAERAGVLEDYILAEISPAAATPTGTSGSAAPATGSMYKLEIAKDEQLSSMVGKRVEVTGRVDAEPGDATGAPPATTGTSRTDRVVGRDRIDLPEFEVSAIRAIAGTCPARPTTAK